MQRYTFILICCLLAEGLWAQTDTTRFLQNLQEHREHYKQEFLTEPQAPLTEADTAQLAFYPPALGWQITARFEQTPDSKPFQMATYSGAQKPYRQYGLLHFEQDGKPYTLAIYQSLRLIEKEEYKDYLFLPFNDSSNGETTYGGGRYLDFKIGDISKDNTLLLDFNLCYNPWCAYSDGYSCPIPPAINHIELAITAGEMLFLGEKKH